MKKRKNNHNPILSLKTKINTIFPFTLILTLTLTSACSTFTSTPTTSATKEAPTIVFQDFSISYANSVISMKETGITKRQGKVKLSTKGPNSFNNPVQVFFLDKAEKRIFTQLIEHPLIQVHEFSTPEGELSKATRVLNQNTFFLKYQSQRELKFIKFQTNPGCQIPIDLKISLK